jgi:hypothetical protein
LGFVNQVLPFSSYLFSEISLEDILDRSGGVDAQRPWSSGNRLYRTVQNTG